MHVILGDRAMENMLARGVKVNTIARGQTAVSEPEHIYTLANGNVRYDGAGVVVIGKPDRTGKFLRIVSIRVAEPYKS